MQVVQLMMASDELGLSVVAQVRTDTGDGRQRTCLLHRMVVRVRVDVVVLVAGRARS